MGECMCIITMYVYARMRACVIATHLEQFVSIKYNEL